ncbi:hypothetical protein [Raoultella terrigena]|nr:hypothetical protein [Raoultella terrigena]MCE9900510.1 hypothetical protein [Raoultella terrigena]
MYEKKRDRGLAQRALGELAQSGQHAADGQLNMCTARPVAKRCRAGRD